MNNEMENAKPDSNSGELGPDESTLTDPGVQLEAITQERDRLSAENEDLRDRILRRQADFENFRRRSEKERLELGEYTGMETVRALLPVLDDFERAIKLKPESTGPEAEWMKGVEMIYQRLSDSLKKLGLEPIESAGKPFDPNIHHAVRDRAHHPSSGSYRPRRVPERVQF